MPARPVEEKGQYELHEPTTQTDHRIPEGQERLFAALKHVDELLRCKSFRNDNLVHKSAQHDHQRTHSTDEKPGPRTARTTR